MVGQVGIVNVNQIAFVNAQTTWTLFFFFLAQTNFRNYNIVRGIKSVFYTIPWLH